jgi:formylglycine-generating enzyme required for sulfatase activity
MHKLSSMILVAAAVLTTSFAQGGDGVTAPWPTNWNNWSDSALWVTVGNPGNAPDTRYATPGYGSVGVVGGSAYNIGKFEVTAGQYTAFLTAVAGVDTYTLYNTNMSITSYGSGITRSGDGVVGNPYTYVVDPAFVNRPVNNVSFWDAARFTNWLQSGNTENGAYHNVGDQALFGRNLDAKFFIPTEDEWFKAAYHDKTAGLAATYFDYPTSNNLAPGQDMADESGNNANYRTSAYLFPLDSPYYATLAGEFQSSASPYGTFDQGGNIWEWNETGVESSSPGLRGGGWYYFTDLLAASSLNGHEPTWEDSTIGFRVASVPEPGSIILIVSGAIVSLILWRRRK